MQSLERAQTPPEDAMKIGLLLDGNIVPIERLQIQLQRRNRAFELMCNRIDKIRLPLVQSNGFDREHQIQHNAD